jgi:hypothetical protein
VVVVRGMFQLGDVVRVMFRRNRADRVREDEE